MSNYNLCILINSLTSGGGEKVAITLCEQYKKKGINVFFVCLERDDHYTLDHKIYYLSKHKGENRSNVKKLFYLFIFALRLKKFLREKNIPFVQSHLNRANYVNVFAGMFGSKHHAQLVNHGIVGRYESYKNLTGKINLFLTKWLYGKADQVILASKGMMLDLKKLGRFQNDLTVINNPFDIENITDMSRESVKEDEFIFDERKKYLIAVGRLEKVKRITDIIMAIAMIRKRSSDVELIILGDGPEKRNINDFIQRLGIGQIIHLLGDVKNPFKYISRADALVSASEYEGFCNVIVEALISGTAVISTDCESGPREILAPGTDVRIKLKPGEIEFTEFGVLVPVGDHESLARAITELLSDVNRLKHYSENGIKRAIDFDKTVIAEKYMSKFEPMMAETSI